MTYYECIYCADRGCLVCDGKRTQAAAKRAREAEIDAFIGHLYAEIRNATPPDSVPMYPGFDSHGRGLILKAIEYGRKQERAIVNRESNVSTINSHRFALLETEDVKKVYIETVDKTVTVPDLGECVGDITK